MPPVEQCSIAAIESIEYGIINLMTNVTYREITGRNRITYSRRVNVSVFLAVDTTKATKNATHTGTPNRIVFANDSSPFSSSAQCKHFSQSLNFTSIKIAIKFRTHEVTFEDHFKQVVGWPTHEIMKT